MNVVRVLGTVAGALLLVGCNMVVSEEPMLERGPDTPVMKQGIWAVADKSGCEYDPTTPVETWPECADPAIIRADGAFLTANKETGKWRATDVVLGTDDPTVAQVPLPEELMGSGEGSPNFVYLAMRPTERDSEGRFTAIETWRIQCGPVDKEKMSAGEEGAMVTQAPFEGLTIVDGNCHAEDVAALTNAAAMSEALVETKGRVRWVKEAGPVETE